MKNKKLRQTVPKSNHFSPKKNNSTIKQLTRSQPNHSEDENFFNQNQQQYNYIPRKDNWNNIDQPDKIYQREIQQHFVLLCLSRQTQQHFSQRQVLAKSSKIMQSQNHIITQGYQRIPMQNSIPLPYYLQQHEITKT